MLEKLKEKLHLSEDVILNICAQEHLLKNVYKKSHLKTIDITFKGDSLKAILKIAKALKVSKDAVIGGMLRSKVNDEN